MSATPGLLAGRHALVTGSAAGLGYAMARGLALAGASVTLNGLARPGIGEAAAAALSAEAGVPVVFDERALRLVEKRGRHVLRSRGSQEAGERAGDHPGVLSGGAAQKTQREITS